MPVPSTYLDSDLSNNKYYVEDEYGRVELASIENIPFPLITGMTVAIIGRGENGKFVCTDACVSGLPIVTEVCDRNPDKKVLLLSGLSYGEDIRSDSCFDRLVDCLTGVDVSVTSELNHALSNVTSVVLLGNIFSSPKRLDESVKV